jgi:DNA-binding LytR/AlgR family response regulator
MKWKPNNMHIAICDDDTLAINQLQTLIARYADERGLPCTISTYTSPPVFLASSEVFDAIFLDVAMPEMDGFSLAHYIRTVDTYVQVVFVTNMGETMSRGYEVMASGFIVKPVKQENVFPVMDRIIKSYEINKPVYDVKMKSGEHVFLQISKIIYIESQLHYLSAHTKTRICEYRGNIAEELSHLAQYGFAQIHRSYIVNMAYVWLVSPDNIKLINNESLAVTRRCAMDFRASYREYKAKDGLL